MMSCWGIFLLIFVSGSKLGWFNPTLLEPTIKQIRPNTIKSKQDPCAKFLGKNLGRTSLKYYLPFYLRQSL
jgi:hypothetical protein